MRVIAYGKTNLCHLRTGTDELKSWLITVDSIEYNYFMDNPVGSLTQLQRSIIIGNLLGDGYLRIVPRRYNAFLEVNHSYSQKEYVDWTFEMLKSICKSGPKMRNGNGWRVAHRFTTRQMPDITELFKLFYANGKKQIPDNLKLDPITLTVWYMDDGSKCGTSSVYFNTQQFNAEDQERCMKMVLDFGIECALNKDKEYFRVRIKASSIPKLFSVISPYIIPSMTYKMGYNPVETYSLRSRVAAHAAANTPLPFSWSKG